MDSPLYKLVFLLYLITSSKQKEESVKIHIGIENHRLSSVIAALCAGQGHDTTASVATADVLIVDNRVKIFDGLFWGKKVIQFIWNDSISSAEDLELFSRFKHKLFICRADDGPYMGTGSFLAALAKIPR